jgi:hypothetical protein
MMTISGWDKAMKILLSIVILAVFLLPHVSHAQLSVVIPEDKDGCYDDGIQYNICVNKNSIGRLKGAIATVQKSDAAYGKPSGLVTELQSLLDQANQRAKELAGSETPANREKAARKARGNAVKNSADAKVCVSAGVDSVICSDV